MPGSVSVSELSSVRNTKPVIVLFFAQGCGYCKRMMPEWKKFKTSSPISIGEVPAEQMSEYNPLHNEGNIVGYPTIRLYNKGKLVKEYDGDRSKNDIMRFVKKYIKENKPNKNNLLLVKAKKGNSLNTRLLKKLTKGKKGTKGTKGKKGKTYKKRRIIK
jgi:thioredoxin-like negative regulator of GroEL